MEDYSLPDLFEEWREDGDELKKAREELEVMKSAFFSLKIEHEKELITLMNELDRHKIEKVERISTLKKEHISELEKIKVFYEKQREIDSKMNDILNQELTIESTRKEQDEVMMDKLNHDYAEKMSRLKEEKQEIEKKLQEAEMNLEITKKIEKNNDTIKKAIGEKKPLKSFERLYRGESSIGKITKKPLLKRSLTKSNV